VSHFLQSNKGKEDNILVEIQHQPLASLPVMKDECEQVQQLLWEEHSKLQEKKYATNKGGLVEGQIYLVSIVQANGKAITMKYFCKIYKPSSSTKETMRNRRNPLFIGLHGGGGCPASFNDSQWENHKRIYQSTYQEIADRDGPFIYVAPRAPTNNWNLWHEGHIDPLFDEMIQTLVALPQTSVDSNRVYISGYSAGGDGLYVLAPRMADRWAGATMMAGHPNGVSLRGVFNLPFSLHVGGKDGAYNRNKVGQQYKDKLEQWQQEESVTGGYQHIWPQIHEEMGHWLKNKDSAALAWMAKYTRSTFPSTLVWDGGSSRHARFYWVLRTGTPLKGEIRVSRSGQDFTIDLSKCTNFNSSLDATITIRLNDTMVNMEESIAVYLLVPNGGERQLLERTKATRTLAVMAQTLLERGDPNAVFSAELVFKLKNVSNQGKTLSVGIEASTGSPPKPKRRLRGSKG
jgi:poly(3-hydroxybutyrate) depolymerase